MPGPLGVWAAKKAIKSKTGQRAVGAVKAKVNQFVAEHQMAVGGHTALSSHQFPGSPPWGETKTSATDTPDFDDVPPWSGGASTKHDPEPPW